MSCRCGSRVPSIKKESIQGQSGIHGEAVLNMGLEGLGSGLKIGALDVMGYYADALRWEIQIADCGDAWLLMDLS